MHAILTLIRYTPLAVCWFESTYMKLNTGKLYLIISGNKHESMWTGIGNNKIWESTIMKLWGVNKDKFNGHISVY